jgi:phage-related protein
MATPHRVIDSVANGIANGAQGIFDGAANALKGAGNAIMNGLDKPFEAVSGGREGPHHIAGRLADGVVNTAQNVVDQGVIGSAKKAGETVMRALDQPPEQIGLPPDLDKGIGFKLGR